MAVGYNPNFGKPLNPGRDGVSFDSRKDPIFLEDKRRWDTTREDRLALQELLLGFLDMGPGTGEGDGAGTGGNPLWQESRDRLVASLDANMADIEQFGDSHRQRITRDFDNSRNSAAANLEARGLGSSSLAPTTQASVDEAYQQTLLGLEDAILGKRIDTRSGGEDQIAGSYDSELNRRAGLTGSLINLLG